jgi:hypothetical protein
MEGGAARLHSGGSANSLMPAYAALAIAMPVGIEAFRTRASWHLVGSVMLALQLAPLFHMWTGTMPTADDRAAGAHYVEFLRRIDGQVLNWHQVRPDARRKAVVGAGDGRRGCPSRRRSAHEGGA